MPLWVKIKHFLAISYDEYAYQILYRVIPLDMYQYIITACENDSMLRWLSYSKST